MWIKTEINEKTCVWKIADSINVYVEIPKTLEESIRTDERERMKKEFVAQLQSPMIKQLTDSLLRGQK